MNPELAALKPYPFEKLATLKAGVTPPAALPHIPLSIGEPRHAPPDAVLEALRRHESDVARYPATAGLPELRQTMAAWATRRFGLSADSLDPERHILPVNGTREAIFAFVQAALDRTRPARVAMPNPFYQTYTVDYLQNVAGGPPVVYLNIPIEEMKAMTQRLLEEGTPVWMGCDVGKQMERSRGLWDAELFESQALYGVKFGMDKATRLRFGQTMMTHAMLFTGVDVVDGRPRRWRVENSWGDDNGIKGFYTMNDNWFDEYMFEIAAPSSHLSDKMREGLQSTPTVLPAWDPMGSLARRESLIR